MRIVVLYSRMAGYMAACLRELTQRTGAELLVYTHPPSGNAPYSSRIIEGIGTVYDRTRQTDKEILNKIEEFSPDVIYVSGWADSGYNHICRIFKKRGVKVIAGMDNQWFGTLKQYVGAITSPFYLKQFIDVLWVAGERQKYMAKKLGYTGDRCWEGLYTCDWPFFSKNRAKWRQKRHFLYIGRYSKEKGVEDLAKAYKEYKGEVENPWGLRCAGCGDYADLLLNAGAEDLGFIQPDMLPGMMQEASALILPSYFEPWGVVIHEAATVGLPIIASDACGAAVHLLKEHYNGYTFPVRNVNALKNRMIMMSTIDELMWREFSEASCDISKQYTPERWVSVFTNGLESIKRVNEINH